MGVDELVQADAEANGAVEGPAEEEGRILVVVGRVGQVGVHLGLLVDYRQRIGRQIRPQEALLEGLVVEAGDDAEVVGAAAQRKEEIRVLLLAGRDDGAAGQHNLERVDGVAGPALLGPQVRDAAASGEPSHANAGNAATGDGQVQGVEDGVDEIPGRAAADGDAGLVVAQRDGVQAAQVDDDVVVAGRAREPLVAAAADGKLALGGGQRLDGAGDIVNRLGRDEALRVDGRDLGRKVRRQGSIVGRRAWPHNLVRAEGD